MLFLNRTRVALSRFRFSNWVALSRADKAAAVSGPRPSAGGFASPRQPLAAALTAASGSPAPSRLPPTGGGSGVWVADWLRRASVKGRRRVLTAWAPRTPSRRSLDLVVVRHINPLRALAAAARCGPEPVLRRQRWGREEAGVWGLKVGPGPCDGRSLPHTPRGLLAAAPPGGRAAPPTCVRWGCSLGAHHELGGVSERRRSGSEVRARRGRSETHRWRRRYGRAGAPPALGVAAGEVKPSATLGSLLRAVLAPRPAQGTGRCGACPRVRVARSPHCSCPVGNVRVGALQRGAACPPLLVARAHRQNQSRTRSGPGAAGASCRSSVCL